MPSWATPSPRSAQRSGSRYALCRSSGRTNAAAFATAASPVPPGSPSRTTSQVPFTKIRFFEFKKPERGDVIVFIYPVDEGKDFIKRVVGLPGDRIHIDGRDVWVNGTKVAKRELEVESYPGDKRRLLVHNGSTYTIPFVRGWRDFDFYEEQTNGANHRKRAQSN